MNDSLRTDIFLRFTSETIACACIDLAARFLQVGSSLMVHQESEKTDMSRFLCRKIPPGFSSSVPNRTKFVTS